MVGSKSIVAGAISSVFLASQVAAHGTLKGLEIDGEFIEGYNPSMQFQTPPEVFGWEIPEDLDNGFVSANNLQDPDIICHKGASPGKTSAPVKAGINVTAIWTDWPESHRGPVITYFARCERSCTEADKTKLKFFKIHEEGLLDGKEAPGFWSSDALIKNNNRISIPIPANISPGQYVMRHEIIALHEGGNEGGAQLYPQCVNLIIEGSGSDLPDGVFGTELYRINDPGIKFNIYQPNDDYPIPGPPMPAEFSGSRNGNGGDSGNDNGINNGNGFDNDDGFNNDGFDDDNEDGNNGNGNGNGNGGRFGAQTHDDSNCNGGNQERKVRKRTFRKF